MRLAAIGLLAGTLALQSSASLPSPGSLAVWGTLGVALALGGLAAATGLRGLMAFLAAAVLGYAWAGFLAVDRLGARLATEHEGRDIVVEGVVVELPQPFDRGVRFTLAVDRTNPESVGLSGPVVLAWYTGPRDDEAVPVLPVRAGERWRFTVRLKRPVGNANPHTYDYEVWLLEQGIRAAGYIRPRGEAKRLDPLAATPRAWLDRARDRIRERLRGTLADDRHAGVLIALAIGDQRAIVAEDWVVFGRTGTAHLMSISGLHVTMIAALAAWGVGALWRRSARWSLRFPAQKAAAIGGVVAALVYCLLAGFGVPAQRTLYMLGAAAIALLADRFQSPSRVLALALVVVVILDPWAVLAAGFWLSFGAVAILFHAARMAREAGRLVAWARAQWAITLGLAPISLALFQQISIVSPLANAVAIPVVSLIVTPLALLAVVVPIDALAHLAHAVLRVVMVPLEWMSTLPAAVWQQHAPAPWTVVLAMIGAAWALAPRGFPARYAGLPLFLPLVLVVPPKPAAGTAWLDVLDVGQGLAVVVRTANTVTVYDTGPAYSPEVDAGNRVLVPFLRGEGISTIDRMIITHLDTDHAGGAVSLAAAVPVAIQQSTLPAGHRARGLGTYDLPCARGQVWTADGVRFEALHPAQASIGEPPRRANSLSCVVRVSTSTASVLLASDIEAREERALVAASADALRSDVLLVPHHGSRTSSTPAFLEAVEPRIAVVAAGYRNRFGHPRPDVLARYAEREIRILRTDLGGRVRIVLDERGVTADEYRSTHRRYWRTLEVDARTR